MSITIPFDLPKKDPRYYNETDVEYISKILLQKSCQYKDTCISINNISKPHLDIYIQAVNNILTTDLAIFAYAQIVDGLPTTEVAWDRNIQDLFGDHPIDEHEELCAGAFDKARELCGKWSPDVLTFSPNLLKVFQNSNIGSRVFEIRLLELVSITLHQFGSLLFQLDFRLHNGDIDKIVNWSNPPPPGRVWAHIPPRPSIFTHSAFLDYQFYPEGIADLVGYWAEDRILGGVVVFNHTEEHEIPTTPPPNAYFIASRRNITSRVFQLTDEQQQNLLDYLLAKKSNQTEVANVSMVESTESIPLPIFGDTRNRNRVSVWEAIYLHGIYRDIWERKPYTEEQIQHILKRPKAEIDYPEFREVLDHVNQMPEFNVYTVPLMDFDADKESWTFYEQRDTE